MTLTKSESAHRTAGLVYCLWLLGFIFGITAVIGVIINHANLSKVRNTHAYPHFLWQIGSFWFVFSGVLLAIFLWPHSISTLLGITCFFAWLLSGLFGSWYLAKSKKKRTSDRQQRTEDHHHPHTTDETELKSLYE